MAKLSDLTDIGGSLSTDDLLYVVNAGTLQSRKTTVGDVLGLVNLDDITCDSIDVGSGSVVINSLTGAVQTSGAAAGVQYGNRSGSGAGYWLSTDNGTFSIYSDEATSNVLEINADGDLLGPADKVGAWIIQSQSTKEAPCYAFQFNDSDGQALMQLYSNIYGAKLLCVPQYVALMDSLYHNPLYLQVGSDISDHLFIQSRSSANLMAIKNAVTEFYQPVNLTDGATVTGNLTATSLNSSGGDITATGGYVVSNAGFLCTGTAYMDAFVYQGGGSSSSYPSMRRSSATWAFRLADDSDYCNISAKKVSAATLNLSGLPTSSSGLSSGDVWNNSGVLTIV